ncbi:MAG: cyclase family protein [bacterium]
MIDYIDLTVSLNKKTPVYPGDPKLKISPVTTVANEGYFQSELSLPTHVGTHIDAPSHLFKEGKLITNYAPKCFIGDGVLVDARGEKIIDRNLVMNLNIKPGNIVLFYTDHIENYFEDNYFTTGPQITQEVANILVQKKVAMVGIDSHSIDHNPYPVHKILLDHDVLLIENLTNLEKLLDKEEFTVVALPIKLALGGAPARVIAITT